MQIAVPLVLVTAIVAFIFVATGGGSEGKLYTVSSSAMEPTFQVNQRVHADLRAYGEASPKEGEIVVANPPGGAVGGPPCGAAHTPVQACPEHTDVRTYIIFVKRVVAGPGDTIAIRGGRAVVNGRPASEGFIQACESGPVCNLTEPVVVPEGEYFLLGDNRADADDSRTWGPVPDSWIIGRVTDG